MYQYGFKFTQLNPMTSIKKQQKAMIERVNGLNEKASALKDEFDLCERDLSVSRKKVRIAKVGVDHAIAIVNGKPQLKNKLEPKDIQRIIQCIKDLSDGKRKFLMLCLNDDKSGLIDMNTENQYFFGE